MLDPQDLSEFATTGIELRKAAARMVSDFGEGARAMRRAATAIDLLSDELALEHAESESLRRRLAEARAERDALVDEIGSAYDGATTRLAGPSVAGLGEMPAQLTPIAGRLSEVDPGLFHLPRSVYFLVRDDRVVYVGESSRILMRLSKHTDDIEFDRAFVLEVPPEEVMAVEYTFIMLFKPRHNRDGREGRKYYDHKSIMARYCPDLVGEEG